MDTSEQSSLEGKIQSLAVTLSSPLKRLFILAILILVVLFLLLFISARDLFFSDDQQAVGSAVLAAMNQQAAESAQRTPEELVAAVTAGDLIEGLTLELQDAQVLTGIAQSSLEESRLQMEETRSQLAENRILLTATQEELAENQTRLAENRFQLEESRAQLAANQSELAEARGALQQSSPAEEELANIQLELINAREQGSARQQQYQRELEEAQRQLNGSLALQDQLSIELAALREALEGRENRDVGIIGAGAIREEEISADEINEVIEPDVIEAASVTAEAQDSDVIVPEELVRRVSPDYPRRAANREIEGSCEVEFTVTTNGEVSDPFIVESDPEGVFDDACLNAIEDFEYRPRTINGTPVETTGLRLTFRFAFN